MPSRHIAPPLDVANKLPRQQLHIPGPRRARAHDHVRLATKVEARRNSKVKKPLPLSRERREQTRGHFAAATRGAPKQIVGQPCQPLEFARRGGEDQRLD